jgi:hypothetical protein
MAIAAPNPDLKVDFDAEEDVLYVSLGAPIPSHADEAPDGLLLRRSNAEDRPSGVTAFDFRQNWRDRRSAFYSLVADYLHVPTQVVERAIEKTI